ncbi:transcription factor grauzone isoform X2 [Drosophila ficusphila]|uniref:transcription factor grauzone isoform X2 n=1 Tax=Drosophila ficusphila TaxID=30025 RepID=UPI0007E7D061|nr:transcription factor grauzone isoform X2 [Drosophila ficusphila]
MICRLCLRCLSPGSAVFLFETDDTLAETRLVKMIAKFLQLEILPDDDISTSVCTDCCEHLEDFNAFWQLVEQKQCSLNKEFLPVDVDCAGMKWTSGVDVDVNIDELPLAAGDMDEKPLDLHNLSVLGSVLDVNVDSVEVREQVKERLPCGSEAEDEKPSLQAGESEPEAPELQLDENSSDDEPLVRLQTKTKSKRKSVARSRDQGPLSLQRKLADLHDDGNKRPRRKPGGQRAPTEVQETELQAVLERKPKGCSRAQLAKRYEEAIASYMSANCDLCEFSAPYLSELKTHFLEVHQREYYIKCCGKIFTRASKLMDHIRKHVNPKLFTCTICQKSLNSQDYLATHIETVHNKVAQIGKVLKFPCTKCERTFSSERRMTNHLAKHDTDQLEHTCEICCKSFANIHRLRRHIQSIHEDLHRHVCDICGKKFKFKPSFERHLLEHQGVVAPAVECPVCGVWLKNEHSLRLHRFTHDSTDTVCPHCGKTCTSRTALRGHVKYAHKLTTNLQCTFCEKSFKQQRNLDEHMAIHTGLQLYNCPHCPKECRSRSNMYVHIKQRHADEWLRAKMARSHNPQFKPGSTDV